MPATVDSILDDAKALSTEDREYLVDALIRTLNPVDKPPFDPELLAECRRRSARIDSGEEKTSTWEEVRERARKAAGLTND